MANKTRLLHLETQVRQLVQDEGLSERHARALLRLGDEQQQLAALEEIARRGYNVERTEQYIESLLQQNRITPPSGRSTYIIKDVRLVLNSVERGLGLMRSSGVDAQLGRQDTEEEILLTIRIPKGKKPAF